MARSSSNTKGKSSGDATASLNELEKVTARVDFLAHQHDEELESKPARSNQPGRFKNPPEEHLGERLKEMRESKHITQGELAALTLSLDSEGKGISRAVISLYEKGTNRPSPKEIRLLCEALKVTPNYLIYGDEQPFTPISDYSRLGTISRRNDPEGYAWVAYVMSIIHHNHYDAVMKLILDLARGWDKGFDQGLQEKANAEFLRQSQALQERLRVRESATKVKLPKK
ncbi:hypothetical protein B9Z39_12895 [Limnohabitans sp. JirII-29]|uniref:helix-turn-helix domain-containing protein n=1 Tax=Limnohabitans sp. JirII-29 TaxID=1835756 RepID=UPI000D3924BC|nr:helix-turn-helix transcriptional regulator [Limnohabitans sp. JirII-29]PUE24624.1 hypothetical protein B9Z39_12895 [Limnohabitans sp. JirII-29]